MGKFKVILLLSVLTVGEITFARSNIIGTKHDLRPTNTAARIRSEAVNEICVFCHTPHHANTAFQGAPLWNKEATQANFTMYGTTIAGTSTDPQPNPPSKACLSCHDGATAINSIVNLPGSGGVAGIDVTGMNYVSMTTDGGTTFSGDGVPVTMPTDSPAHIGTDLTNDHPISIVYNAPNADPDQNPGSLRPTNTALTGTWLVRDSDGSGGPTIGDLLRNGRVECPSCHDPHAENPIVGLNPNTMHPMFLRRVGGNINSVICLTCHAKAPTIPQ